MLKYNLEEFEKRLKAVEKYFYKEVCPVSISFEEWADDYEILIYCVNGDTQSFTYLDEINEIYENEFNKRNGHIGGDLND